LAAKLFVVLTGFQLHLSHSGYRRQCLAAESHGANGKKVVGSMYLGCGMAFETESSVNVRHSTTIVDDLY
jgi:hypothetical protein